MPKTSLYIVLISLPIWPQSKFLSPHGELRWKCESCHTPASFFEIKEPTDFQHRETGYLLLGNHKYTDCADCHKDLRFANIGTACADCHTDVHRGQFGFSCQNCHTPEQWKNERNILDIHATRGFSLIGVHATVDCQACHIDEQRNEFTMTPADCAACHISDYLATTNPDHIQSGFDTGCQACHILLAVSWEYLDVGGFKTMNLRGLTLPLDCEDCH